MSAANRQVRDPLGPSTEETGFPFETTVRRLGKVAVIVSIAPSRGWSLSGSQRRAFSGQFRLA